MQCSLCFSNDTSLFYTEKSKTYFKCNNCDVILLDQKKHISLKEEKLRYDKHSSDINDKGYQNFVQPIISAVEANFSANSEGLDFGCGHTAIIQILLQKKGFSVLGYDPIYNNNISSLNNKYNFITCCEVVEHFYKPNIEFKLLRKLLKPKGKLFLKTNLYTNDINFSKWWYKNDPTHVIFYTPKSMEFICKHFNFHELSIFKKHIELSLF